MSTQSDQPSAPIELKSFSNPNARTIPDLLSEAKSLTEQVRLAVVRDDLSGAESAAKQLTSLRSNYRSAFDELDRLHILAGMSDAMGGYDPRIPSPVRGGVGLDLPDYTGGTPLTKRALSRMRQDAGYASPDGLAGIWSDVAQLRAQDTMLRVSGVDTDILRKVKNGEITLKPQVTDVAGMDQWLGVTPDAQKGTVYQKAIFNPLETTRGAVLDEFGDTRGGNLLANIATLEDLDAPEMQAMLSRARSTARATGDRANLAALNSLDAKKIKTGIEIERGGAKVEASLDEVRRILRSTDASDDVNKGLVRKALNTMISELPEDKKPTIAAELTAKLGLGTPLLVTGDKPSDVAGEKKLAAATEETGAVARFFGLGSEFEKELESLREKAPGYSRGDIAMAAATGESGYAEPVVGVPLADQQNYWADIWKRERARSGANAASGNSAGAKRSAAIADYAAKEAALVIDKRIKAKEVSVDGMSADTELLWKAGRNQSAPVATVLATSPNTAGQKEVAIKDSKGNTQKLTVVKEAADPKTGNITLTVSGGKQVVVDKNYNLVKLEK